MWAQSQEHLIIDRLEERSMKRGSARRSSLKGRKWAIVNQTNIGTCFKSNVGETAERRDGAHMGISEHTHIILNWDAALFSLCCSVLLAHQRLVPLSDGAVRCVSFSCPSFFTIAQGETDDHGK